MRPLRYPGHLADAPIIMSLQVPVYLVDAPLGMWGRSICPRQDFADQRKVRPEAITLPPISKALYRSRLPTASVNIDAIPLPSLR